jgi:hypothetical protein
MSNFKALVMGQNHMPASICIKADTAEQAKIVWQAYVEKLGLTKYQYDEMPQPTALAVFPFIN